MSGRTIAHFVRRAALLASCSQVNQKTRKNPQLCILTTVIYASSFMVGEHEEVPILDVLYQHKERPRARVLDL